MDPMPPVEPVAVPALDEWGMIAMFAVLGIAALIALSMRFCTQPEN